MSTPIYAPDPFASTNEWLMKLLVAKQQQEVQKEQISLQKKELELRSQKAQQDAAEAEQRMAQQQGPQVAAQTMLQSMLQQAAAPAIQQWNPVSGQMMAPPQMGEPAPQAAVQYGQLQANPQTKLAAAPDFAKQAQAQLEDRNFEKYMKTLRGSMTDQEFGQYQSAIEMVRRGVPKEMVDAFIPESAKETADRLKVVEEIRAMKSVEEADNHAFEALKRYGITLPSPKGANQLLQNQIVADRAFARARQLQRENNDRADARQNVGHLQAVQRELKSSFVQSPVVKSAQTLSAELVKIRDLSVKRTGMSDTGMVYSYIKMLDEQTGVKEGEQKQVRTSGSLAQRGEAIFLGWKNGTKLTDEQRAQLVEASEQIIESHKGGAFREYVSWYARNASAAGIELDSVTYDPYKAVKPKAEWEAEQRTKRALGK